MRKILKYATEFSFTCNLNCHLTTVLIAHMSSFSAVNSIIFLKGAQDIKVSWRKNETHGDESEVLPFIV